MRLSEGKVWTTSCSLRCQGGILPWGYEDGHIQDIRAAESDSSLWVTEPHGLGRTMVHACHAGSYRGCAWGRSERQGLRVTRLSCERGCAPGLLGKDVTVWIIQWSGREPPPPWDEQGLCLIPLRRRPISWGLVHRSKARRGSCNWATQGPPGFTRCKQNIILSLHFRPYIAEHVLSSSSLASFFFFLIHRRGVWSNYFELPSKFRCAAPGKNNVSYVFTPRHMLIQLEFT